MSRKPSIYMKVEDGMNKYTEEEAKEHRQKIYKKLSFELIKKKLILRRQIVLYECVRQFLTKSTWQGLVSMCGYFIRFILTLIVLIPIVIVDLVIDKIKKKVA